MVTNKKDLTGERRLSDSVKKHPCLYDKETIEYKTLSNKSKAWKSIESELELEPGTASKQFRILYKRYSRKRHNYKKALAAGTADEIEKSKADYEEYNFFHWLNDHLRDYRSQPAGVAGGGGDDDKDEQLYDDESMSGDVYTMVTNTLHGGDRETENNEQLLVDDNSMPVYKMVPTSPLNQPHHLSTSKVTLVNVQGIKSNYHHKPYHQSNIPQPSPRCTQLKTLQPVKASPNIQLTSTTQQQQQQQQIPNYHPIPIAVCGDSEQSQDHPQTESSNSNTERQNNALPKYVSERRKEITSSINYAKKETSATCSSKDSGTSVSLDDIFGQMIAAELKTFPENIKFRVKHELNNVIFKFREKQLETS